MIRLQISIRCSALTKITNERAATDKYALACSRGDPCGLDTKITKSGRRQMAEYNAEVSKRGWRMSYLMRRVERMVYS
jgi:hypothetical protein